MRVTDVSVNSQASLIAQQHVAAAQQQTQQNATMQFILEAQRALDKMADQVNQPEQPDERQRVREDDHDKSKQRQYQDQMSGQPGGEDADADAPSSPRIKASEPEKGRYIDIDA